MDKGVKDKFYRDNREELIKKRKLIKMIRKKLYLHQILSFIRRPQWKLRFAVKFFILFVVLLWLGNLALLSYLGAGYVTNSNSASSTIKLLNSYLLYCFIVLFFVRFLFQPIPMQIVRPYLHMPVKRREIIQLFLVRSFFNIFNIIPLFIFLPFGLRTMTAYYSFPEIILWMIGILLFSLCNNLLIVFLKSNSVKYIVLVFMIFVLTAGLNYQNIISLEVISLTLFGGLLGNIFYISIPLILFILIYLLNSYYLMSLLCIDKIRIGIRKGRRNRVHFSGTISGIVLRLIWLEFKLILRNKRPRWIFFSSFIFLLLAINFTVQAYFVNTSHSIMKLFSMAFAASLMSGFIINYLGMSLSWESTYFDFIKSGNIGFKSFVKSKYMFGIILATMGAFIGIIFSLIIKKEAFIIYIICLYLFNTGICLPAIIYSILINPQRISIGESPFFNYQGANNSIYSFLPFAAFLMIFTGRFFISVRASFIIVGITGLTGILLYYKWIYLTLRKYNKRKYQIAENLRGQYS